MDEYLRHVEDQIVLWKSRNGKTDNDLAETIGVSKQSLYNKRNGISEFRLDELIALCEAIGTDLNGLVGWPPNG